MSERQGRKIGRFHIVATHESVGIAQIVTATDPENDSELVTIDILSTSDAATLERALDYASRAKAFTDETIFPVLEIDTDGPQPFVVRTHERGVSLAQILESEGSQDPHTSGRLIARLARLVDRIHARGLVHGTIGPATIRQSDPDAPFRLTSLGRIPQIRGRADDQLRYTAPELLTGTDPSERSDIYALGHVFYFMLTGKPAFETTDPVLLAAQISEGGMPDRNRRTQHVADSFWNVVERATTALPEARYRTGNAMAEALESALARTKPVERQEVEPAPVSTPAPPIAPKTVYWPARLLLAGSLSLILFAGFVATRENGDDDRSPDVILPSVPSRDIDRKPAPPPVQPDSDLASISTPLLETWQDIAAQLPQSGCNWIDPIPVASGTAFGGLVDDPVQQIELSSRLAHLAEPGMIALQLASPETEICRMLESLSERTKRADQRLIQLPARKPEASATVGDLLVLDIDTPLNDPTNGFWYVLVGYLTSNDQFVLLSAGPHSIDALAPGSAARVGEPTRGEWFRLTEPAGLEVAFVIFADEPLPNDFPRTAPINSATTKISDLLSTLESRPILSILPVTIQNN